MNGFVTIIDFETTGFGDCYGTEIGILALNSKFQIVSEFQSLLKPPIPASPAALRVTGLSSAQLRAAPEFGDLWHLIHPFISDRVLVAHNASFDMGVLNRELARLGIRNVAVPSFCTLKHAKTTWDLQDYKLGTLATHVKAPKYAAHAALGDCHATKHVLHEIVNGNQKSKAALQQLGLQTVTIKPSKMKKSANPKFR